MVQMTTPDAILCSVAIASVSVIIATCCLPSEKRFYLTDSGDNGLYRIDQLTGHMWQISDGVMQEIKIPEIMDRPVGLPPAVISSITATASYGPKDHSSDLPIDPMTGELYNPSDWDIVEIVVAITNGKEKPADRWYREFRVRTELPAKSIGSFRVETGGGGAAGATQFSIVGGSGRQRQ